MTGFNNSESDIIRLGAKDKLMDPELSTYVFVFNLLIVLVGVPGNLLILAVYRAKPSRTTTAVFIIALAAADLFACLARFGEVVHQGMRLAGSVPPVALYHVIWVTNNLALTVAAAVTALVALDRYDCVCRHTRRLLDYRRARFAVGAVCCLSLVANVPLFVYISGFPDWMAVVFARQVLFYSIDVLVVLVCYGKVFAAVRRHVQVGVHGRRPLPVSNNPSRFSNTETSTQLQNIRQGDAPSLSPDDQTPPNNPTVIPSTSKPGCSFHSSAVLATTEPVPPEVAESGTQVTTASGTDDQELQQRNLDAGARRPAVNPRRPGQGASLQRKTTRMLFMVTLIFLLTYVPYWIFMNFTLSGRPEDSVYEAVANAVHLLYLNNAINPLIYGVANRRFRKDVGDVLRKTCKRT